MDIYLRRKLLSLFAAVFTACFFYHPFVSEGNVFGNLDGLFVKGTITAEGHYDRTINFSINNGVLEGKVSASQTYLPRSIIMTVKGPAMHGEITSTKLNSRTLDFTVTNNSLRGTATAENINPRFYNLVIGKNTIQGLITTEKHPE